MWSNRIAVIATKHKKEQVIAPILEREFRMTCIIPTQFDTDQFGTFTREMPRAGSQLEAARQKAEQVLDLTQETLAIASEGAFGPHPAIPFLPCDRELILLCDRQNQLELVAYELSTETNYGQQTVTTLHEALEFAKRVGFPDHALVVRANPNAHQPGEIYKGIQNEDRLVQTVTAILDTSSTRTAYLETDMRAMYNPSRMKVIERAVLGLVKKMNQRCPTCQHPGFDVIKQLPGLPCAMCNTPTPLTLTDIYQCQSCQFERAVKFPTRHQFADPTYCRYCNP
ncbi:MAG: DUF6671 family protein [Elainellaceae cyanobacterium]